VAQGTGTADLAPQDLEHLPGLIAAANRSIRSGDPKAEALIRLLSDRRPTMVFSCSIATLRYLRERIPWHGTAWLSGQGAGVDAMSAHREVVLDWFRLPPPEDSRLPSPSVLLATDVAAEGLDLPRIERIVHYDLPWTAVRLEQRAGRALRLGSRLGAVEIIRFLPPGMLGRALQQQRILEDKAGLPSEIGLDAGPEAAWRIRARLAAEWDGCPKAEGVAMARGREAGIVAGVRVELSNGSARELVLARSGRRWDDDPALIARLLASVGPAPGSGAPTPGSLRGLSPRIAALLRQIRGEAMGPGRRHGSIRRMLRRLRDLSTRFARSRDSAGLRVVANAMTHVRRSHTAGEEDRITRWVQLPDRALLASLTRLPPEPIAPVPVQVKLIGLLVVEA
jgi:hypothetical protein